VFSKRAPWTALVLTTGLAAGACGKRGDPLPPMRHVPGAVSELRVAQRGDQLEVSLVAPRTATDNSRLPVIEIEILRAPAAGDFAKVARATVRKAAPGERLVEEEPLPPLGTVLRFAARARLQGRSSSQSPVATLTVGKTPPAPTDLVVKSVPKGVGLEWSAPPPSEPAQAAPNEEASPSPPDPVSPSASPSPTSEPSPVAPPEGVGAPSPGAGVPSPAPSAAPSAPPAPSFFIYRRSDRGSYGEPLVKALTVASTFQDESALPGERWCYVVRTVASTSPLIESEASNEACLTVEDVAPPETPVGLAARETDEGVEVSWSPSSEADLKVYRIYRADGEGPAKRIAEVPAGTSSYVDVSAPRGVPLHYSLGALDAAGNESPRSSPAAALRP
jgi:hypothetical protein